MRKSRPRTASRIKMWRRATWPAPRTATQSWKTDSAMIKVQNRQPRPSAWCSVTLQSDLRLCCTDQQLSHMSDRFIIRMRYNLEEFLQSFRPNPDCWLWIDVICMNQSSLTKRNHQIRMMADIYSRPDREVVVGLRSTDENAGIRRALRYTQAAACYDRNNVYYHTKDPFR